MLEENWDAVQVFTRCRQDYIAGMTGAFALGFSGVEVQAGCRLAGLSRRAWPEVSEQVQQMGVIAANETNSRAKP